MLAKRHAALAQQAERRLIQWLKVSGSNPLGRNSVRGLAGLDLSHFKKKTEKQPVALLRHYFSNRVSPAIRRTWGCGENGRHAVMVHYDPSLQVRVLPPTCGNQ